jgi:glycosyltransferase involved in cell wall biosynthesis
MAAHPDPFGEPEIVLDLSRLLSRVTHPTPTGVDRCEMAYARGLLAIVPDRLSFAAVHPAGFYGRLPTKAVLRFLDLTEERWASRGFDSLWDKQRFVASALAALRPRMPMRERSLRPRVYLQASPNNLTRSRLIGRILAYEAASFVCLVHDLIPLEFPEYAKPDGAALHRKRVATMVQYATGIVANSHATMQAIMPHFDKAHRSPATAVAHLGLYHEPDHFPHDVPPTLAARPYFLAIGTIEPRKNHLLLLNIWRRMAQMRGSDNVPRLIIVGRRGWENEQVIDMLERCQVLQGCVEEISGLPDDQMQTLLRGARALLMPSFAEGYGMPVTEALASRVPVLCSDLAALREAGGDVPEFLDPLNGSDWLAAVLDYAGDSSERRAEQLRRMQGWNAPTWAGHVAILLNMLHRLPK